MAGQGVLTHEPILRNLGHPEVQATVDDLNVRTPWERSAVSNSQRRLDPLNLWQRSAVTTVDKISASPEIPPSKTDVAEDEGPPATASRISVGVGCGATAPKSSTD